MSLGFFRENKLNASGECFCNKTPYTKFFKTKCLFAEDCDKCCRNKIGKILGTW